MAVYRPILLDPNKATRDMLVEQTFSAILQSTTTDYQVKIYKISDNSLLYDSTKVTLGEIKYPSETLSIVIPITVALATVRDLKWTIEVWNGVSSALSRETPFTNYETPTLSLTVPATITEQSYEFIVTYTQTQDIAIGRYKYTLYDSNQIEVSTSNWIYNSSGRYTFDNFLDGVTYFVVCEIYDENEIYITTDFVGFDVDYIEPSVLFTPVVTNKPYLSAMEVKWTGAYSLEGVATGANSYVNDFLYLTNKGLLLDNGAFVEWSGVNIEDEYVTSFWHNPSNASFSGDIIKFEHETTGDYQFIGYDGSKFYRNQNGTYDYTIDITFNQDNIYLIMFTAESVYVKSFATGMLWSDYQTNIWNDLLVYTWQDILDI